MAPEACEVVVGAGFCLEDVDDEVAVVYKHPFAAVVALYAAQGKHRAVTHATGTERVTRVTGAER